MSVSVNFLYLKVSSARYPADCSCIMYINEQSNFLDTIETKKIYSQLKSSIKFQKHTAACLIQISCKHSSFVMSQNRCRVDQNQPMDVLQYPLIVACIFTAQ